jgi:AcrR family transcriptional regulator
VRRGARRELKYEAIYKAALEVFAEYGFRKATIEDIASRLKTGKSSLYFYIKDKRDLYEKSVAYGLRRWQEKVRRAVASEDDVVAQFLTMASKGYEHLSQDRALQRILERDPSLFPLDGSRDPFAEINASSVEMVRDVLARGTASGRFRDIDADRVASLLFSIYVMLVQKTYMFERDSLTRTMFKDGLDLLLNGLLARVEEARPGTLQKAGEVA